MGKEFARAYNYNAAVMKPWGKKNADNQKLTGGPLYNQSLKNLILSIKSSIHEESGFNDG